MLRFKKEQRVCHIGSIKVGGQPGENPPLLIGNIFQKGDGLIESRKERKFDRQKAGERLQEMERLSQETGLPAMLAMVANSADEMKAYIDFYVSATALPFAIDIWMPQTRLTAARYAAELGLQERLLYNSITPWDEDIEGQVLELKELGIKHVVVQAFDMEDKGPNGRIKALKRMMPLVEKGCFQSILIDTAVMSLPFTAFSLVANRLVKEEYGLPAGCAPSNGTYMWRKAVESSKSSFPAIDAAIEAVTAMGSDFIFYGPMTGTGRVFYAVAAATALLVTLSYTEGKPLSGDSPLHRLFPDAVEQLLKEEGG